MSRDEGRENADIEGLVAEALADFTEAAALARAGFAADQIVVQILPKPHRAPSSLPAGKMAVYAFFLSGQALKVGKVGPKSQARYTSQHYSGSAMSTLAGSILLNPGRAGAGVLDLRSVGEWIRTHTDRVNLLLPATAGMPVLSLLEAFLHIRWKPMFEGRAPSED